jgi:hypothetical protein
MRDVRGFRTMRRPRVRTQRVRSVARGAFVVVLAAATSAWQEASKQQRRLREQREATLQQPVHRQQPPSQQERERAAREQRVRQQREREAKARVEPAAPREAAAKRTSLPEDLRATARAMADQQNRHRQRLARIERLRQLYRERNDQARLAVLDQLRTKENARYARYLDERRRELGPERYAQVERALGAGSSHAGTAARPAERTAERSTEARNR